MPNNFLICAYPRTGSYHLVGLLNSANDIVCHGELFKEGVIELQPGYHVNITREERDRDPIAYIRALQALKPQDNFGFKLFQSHVAKNPALRGLLHSPDWKKVILVRDAVEVYASLLRAKKTNVWIVDGEQRVDEQVLNEKVRFAPESWRDHVKSFGSWLQICMTIENSFVAVYGEYEKQIVMANLLKFLGSSVDARSLSSPTKKQFKGAVQDGFENWSEFADYMKEIPPPALPSQSRK